MSRTRPPSRSVPITETDQLQNVRNKYGIDEDALRGLGEPLGEMPHLSPQDGHHDLGRMVDALDSSGYSGPVVLELAPPFRTPEALRQTIDALRTGGWWILHRKIALTADST